MPLVSLSRRASLAALLALLILPTVTHAQPAWPSKPITLIVPFSAGGNVDTTARLIAQRLQERLKQSVVVENIAGAGGLVGVQRAVQAAPDGHTLVMAFDGPIAITKYINPAAVRFDPSTDLLPVALTTTAPMVLVARNSLGVDSMDALVALARKDPGRLSYATSGVGTVLHLAMEMVKERAKIFAVHIPYRGGAQIASDVIGGQVDLAMMVSVSATPHVQAGRMKALAVTGPQRLPTLPNVPTLTELPLFKGLVVESWTGVFAPKGTPAAILDRLHNEIAAVLAEPEVRAKLADGGAQVGRGDRASFARFIAAEQARFEKIVRAANIKE
ncbi:MAG: tripartite tricarboxylate transporter substrate binding protein [Proteobacteria bacterium]|nr:tripartite tricarboxylate transporter substrate binding protein [Pseudomonadota bacterium]